MPGVPDRPDASLQRLQWVADALPAPVAYVTPDRRYAVVNQRYARWFGADPAELIGRPVREVLGEAVYGKAEAHMTRALAGERVSFDAEIPHGRGTRYVEATYIPDGRDDGSVGGLVVLIRDVTARKRLEHELREQALPASTLATIGQLLSGEHDLERLAQAVEAVRQDRFLAEIIPQLVWANDRTGALEYVNQRWVDYTGFDLERSRQDGWRGVLHPDDAARTSLAWAHAVSTGSLYEVTARIRRGSDGVFRWFLARAFPRVDEDGTVLQWFGTCTDIHDQKRHEDSERLLSEAGRVLTESLVVDRALEVVSAMIAAWFRGYCIIDLLGDGGLRRAAVAHVDPDRQPVMDALRAFSPGEDRDNPLWQVLLSRRTEVCNHVTDARIRQAAQSEMHEDLRRRMGTTGYMIVPLMAGGQAVGTLMLASTTGEPFEDEDVRPVEELAYRIAIAVTNARAYAQVQEANRLKDEFLAIVSHELRTPLNAMRGWMSLLRSDKLPEEQRGRALEVIERNITAQTQLVDDLLDISRIVSGRMRLHIQWADLTAIVASAIESVAPAAEAKQITIEPTLDLDVGPVRGDTARLQQVVWNLLSNAIKFTPRGGRVMVSVKTAGPAIELAVADTGTGISPEFLPHVFDRFRQGDSAATRPFGGLGLGLAIVRHLVELHGGTVTAASEGEGYGATFVVSLPKVEHGS